MDNFAFAKSAMLIFMDLTRSLSEANLEANRNLLSNSEMKIIKLQDKKENFKGLILRAQQENQTLQTDLEHCRNVKI